MVSQDCTHLTIKQIKALLENNGLAANGNEYCQFALLASLHDKQQKAANAYIKSEKFNTDHFNAYSKCDIETQLPPKMPNLKNNKQNKQNKIKFILKYSINEEFNLISFNLRKFHLIY